MITFKQYITELFDKPYNAKERESNLRPTDYGGNMGQQTFEAKTKDGDTLGIRFGHFSSKPSKAFPDGNYEITVEFWIRPSGGGRATMGITGKGDAGRIMATVLDITEEVIEEYDPTRLTFHADKFANPAAKEKVESGRIGLYNAMVKRFAKKNGFSAKLPNPKTVEKRGEATYHLNKIGTRVWDKVITEKAYKIGVMDDYSKPKFKEIRGLINPSMDELTAFTMRTKWKSVRIIAGWSRGDNLYVWDANLATHPDVMKGENLDYKKYATGMLSWIDQFAKFDEKIWSLELGSGQDEAQDIGKKHRGLKDLLKKFPDTQLDGFWGA